MSVDQSKMRLREVYSLAIVAKRNQVKIHDVVDERSCFSEMRINYATTL